VPIPDEQLEEVPYYRPAANSPEIVYLKRQRERLGGSMPRRLRYEKDIEIPDLKVFETVLKGSGERTNSTTMSFVRLLAALVRDKHIGSRIVPIVPDEARTFGMEGMFRQLGIYSSEGQLYEPEDSGEIAAYRESKDGQVLEEGISEAGSVSAWMAAASSYSSHRCTLIPFFIFYSMFGFQRIGDFAWAAGDMQARGFLIGGTAGRTTLNGEGLQHQDGHSHVLASTVPNCRSYDPAYGYELAVIVHDGMKRMYEQGENCFYYVTVMNEQYQQPPMPEGVADGIIRGMYKLATFRPNGAGTGEAEGGGDRRRGGARSGPKSVRLLGSGTILREVIAAAEWLAEQGIDSEVWSVTSFTELRRDGGDVDRWNLLHPDEEPRRSYVEQCLGDSDVPIVAATDYIKVHSDQIRKWITAPYHVLGTDGFGRSDTREQLRNFFEVDRRFVSLAALHLLAAQQKIGVSAVRNAMDEFGIEQDKANPRLI
jgi:pyruvate dehydrogenase E1 component